MKKLFLAVLILMFCGIANAADLKWDASLNADGYNIYFTDGTDNFHFDAGNTTEIVDIDNILNLHPGKTYIFHATAYNQMGESGASNTADYTTQGVYTPPGDVIPIRVERPTVITIIVE